MTLGEKKNIFSFVALCSSKIFTCTKAQKKKTKNKKKRKQANSKEVIKTCTRVAYANIIFFTIFSSLLSLFSFLLFFFFSSFSFCFSFDLFFKRFIILFFIFLCSYTPASPLFTNFFSYF